jgi:hypothetical protein
VQYLRTSLSHTHKCNQGLSFRSEEELGQKIGYILKNETSMEEKQIKCFHKKVKSLTLSPKTAGKPKP